MCCKRRRRPTLPMRPLLSFLPVASLRARAIGLQLPSPNLRTSLCGTFGRQGCLSCVNSETGGEREKGQAAWGLPTP